MGSEEGAEELVQMNVLCRTTYEKRGAAGARVGGRARVCVEGVARRQDRDVGCVARTRAAGAPRRFQWTWSLCDLCELMS